MAYLLYSVTAILFIGVVFFIIHRAQGRSAELYQDQSRFDQHRNEMLHILAAHEAKKIAEAEAAANEQAEKDSTEAEPDGEPT